MSDFRALAMALHANLAEQFLRHGSPKADCISSTRLTLEGLCG